MDLWRRRPTCRVSGIKNPSLPRAPHRVEPFRYLPVICRVVVIERLFRVESTKEVADPDDANDGIESLILTASISIR
jgi:hypothetical protein